MSDRGRGRGRRPPNRGGRHNVGRVVATTSFPSSIHISTSESAVPTAAVGQTQLPIVQEELHPITPTEATPPATHVGPEGSQTPEYPPLPESSLENDQRPLLQVLDGE